MVLENRYVRERWRSNSTISAGPEVYPPLARREARVRMALTELGPTFIKLGQVLSLRPDLVGSDLAAELQSLQANVPADSFDSVKRVVESELKKPIAEAFDCFDENAMASASIGQAHTAQLPDGTRVVVKVQHENIRGKINEDLEVLAGLATLAERMPELAAWQPRSIVDQLSRSLKRELSFSQEQANLLMMRDSFKDFPGILIPKPYASHSSARVLSMDQLEGRSINDVHNRELFPDLDLDALAHRVAAI